MLAFALWLDRFIGAIFPVVVVCFLCAWVTAFVALVRFGRSRAASDRNLFHAAAVVGIVLIAAQFPILAFANQVVRRDVLLGLSAPVSRVEIDGRPAAHAATVVQTLRSMDRRPAHHSHPTRSSNVDLWVSSRRLSLVLRQDSGDPNEYWVFDSRMHFANEIGRVTMEPLDLAQQSH